MATLRNKNIGKYIISVLIVFIAIISNYNVVNKQNEFSKFEKGTVIGKNESMTYGKYPKQKFIIAFKFDNPKYGIQDINATFSSWNSLKVGDRTSFKPNGNFSGIESFWWILACIIDMILLMTIVVFIGFLMKLLWEY